MRYRQHVSTKETRQTERVPGSKGIRQVENSAGGFVWAVDDWKRLDRFLILGSEGGSYYASEKELSAENAQAVFRCVEADGRRAVARIVEISDAGRAAKNDPALFALAIAASTDDRQVRKAALDALPKVARIGTHLFHFLHYIEGFRGWGQLLREAIAGWYASKEIDALAHQIVKYRQRDGWSHRDALRLAHLKPSTPEMERLLGFAVRWGFKEDFVLADDLPQIVTDFVALQGVQSKKEITHIIERNANVTWEMIPSQFLGEPEVWEALLPNLPFTALLRNLGRMSANGLLKPLSEAERIVCAKLSNHDTLRKARVHPIQALSAFVTYKSGHGARGSLYWNPCSKICDALEDAFHASFGNVQPSGKRIMLALDVSDSMGMGEIAGVPGLCPAVAAACMAMVTARTEQDYYLMGFANEFRDLKISGRDSLEAVISKTSGLNFGGTDCALPMVWALKNGVKCDAFIIYTDNETWCGNIHPFQALNEYRSKVGIAARMVTVGMISNGFTIADPDDAGMLDVVGFDTSTSQLISDFTKGDL